MEDELSQKASAESDVEESEGSEFEDLKELVNLRFVNKVRSGSPVLAKNSPQKKDANQEDLLREEEVEELQIQRYESGKLAFDPWRDRPIAAEAQNIFFEKQWLKFHTLEPETNLAILPPEGWMSSEKIERNSNHPTVERPRWTRLWRRSDRPELMEDWEEDTWWLLEYAFQNEGQPDFIGSAQTLKELFTIPYTNDAVSLMVYRVGSSVYVGNAKGTSLAVESEESGVFSFAPGSSSSSRVEWRRDSGNLGSLPKYSQPEAALPNLDSASSGSGLHWVVHHGDWVDNMEESNHHDEVLSHPSSPVSEQTTKDKTSQGTEARESRATPNEDVDIENGSVANEDLLRRFYDYSSRGQLKEEEEENESSAQHQTRFRRTLSWLFDGMEIVVGSNLLVFKDDESSPLSARLHDVSKAMSDGTCLDFYLENRLAGVPRLALCLHQGGLIRDYRIYNTEDIPNLIGSHTLYEDNRKIARSAFSPRMLEQKAAQLLHFLQERLQQGEAYWLFKKQNSNVIHLCEMGNAPKISKQARERWMYTMAMLCYRVALQYASKRKGVVGAGLSKTKSSQSRSKSKKSGFGGKGKKGEATLSDLDKLFLLSQERDLLMKSLELLQEILADGGPPRLVLQAKLNEEVAETYIAEAEIIQHQLAESWKENQQVHPEHHLTMKVRYALAHWQYVLNCLWAYRRACTEDLSDSESAEEEEEEESKDIPKKESRTSDAEQALTEIEQRLQSRVFHCFLVVAFEHRRVGNLDKSIEAVSHGLLCKDMFDQWKPDWAVTHHPKDLAEAFQLLGDVLLELSKRAIHSSNVGPNHRCALTWLEYSKTVERKMKVVVDSVLKNHGEIEIDYLETSLKIGENAENLVSSESICLTGIALFTAACKMYKSCENKADVEQQCRRTEWKLANSWNELGKLRVSNGKYNDGKVAYVHAVERFTDAGDIQNAALVYLNLNHMFRTLGMSCSSDKSKAAPERMENQRMYIDEGLQFLQVALNKVPPSEKGWIQRIKLEEAMNHLMLGVMYSTACKQGLFGGEKVQSLLVDSSKRAVSHLNLSLQIYEGFRGVSLAEEKSAAVHYHIGSHLAWISRQEKGMLSDLGTGKEKKTLVKLVKRHYAMALKTLSGPSADQARAELAAFLAEAK